MVKLASGMVSGFGPSVLFVCAHCQPFGYIHVLHYPSDSICFPFIIFKQPFFFLHFTISQNI